MNIQSFAFQAALLTIAAISGLLSPLVAAAVTVISAVAIPAVIIATVLTAAFLINEAGKAYKEMKRDRAIAELELS